MLIRGDMIIVDNTVTCFFMTESETKDPDFSVEKVELKRKRMTRSGIHSRTRSGTRSAGKKKQTKGVEVKVESNIPEGGDTLPRKPSPEKPPPGEASSGRPSRRRKIKEETKSEPPPKRFVEKIVTHILFFGNLLLCSMYPVKQI